MKGLLPIIGVIIISVMIYNHFNIISEDVVLQFAFKNKEIEQAINNNDQKIISKVLKELQANSNHRKLPYRNRCYFEYSHNLIQFILRLNDSKFQEKFLNNDMDKLIILNHFNNFYEGATIRPNLREIKKLNKELKQLLEKLK